MLCACWLLCFSSPLLIKDFFFSDTFLTNYKRNENSYWIGYTPFVYNLIKDLGSPETGIKLDPVDRKKGRFPAFSTICFMNVRSSKSLLVASLAIIHQLEGEFESFTIDFFH